MTQTVTAENGEIFSFPDDMRPDVMDAFIKRHLKQTAPVSAGEDIKKALPYSIPKAVAGLGGVIGDARTLLQMGKDKLPALPEWAQKIENFGANSNPLNLLLNKAPTSADLRGAAETVTGPWYDPQTRPGKIADTLTQTATTMGRNWITTPVRAAALTGAITAGTEGAGALTNDNPWARFAGGLVGGIGPTVANAMRQRTGAVVRDAVGDLSPAQIAEAERMQRQSNILGIPLFGTESLDRGHELAGKVLASLSGGPRMRDFLNRRPAQVLSAANAGLIAPTRNYDTPAVNAARAQTTATDVISAAENNRALQTRPFYEAARRDVVPPENLQAVSDVIANQRPFNLLPAQQAALNRYDSVLNRPGMNAITMDDLYRSARAEAEVPAIGATSEQQQAAASMRPVAQALNDASQTSPNLVAGRALHRRITENVIDPLNAGPVGRLATRAGFEASDQANVAKVTSAISDTKSVRPQDIRTLYRNLNGQDRAAFPGIAKTWIENEINSAVADLRSGPNPTAGAKLRESLVGTPQQQANFNETMRGVAHATGANPDDVVRGANVLMQTLERTGRTPGIGSPTDLRGEIGRELGKTYTSDALNMVSGKPLGGWMKRYDDWVLQGRFEGLSRVLTAPDSVQQLVRLAKLSPNGLTARFYLASLLGLDRAIAQ